MNKLCNVFLLNLILLSGNHHFEARFLGPLSLDEVRLDSEDAQDLPEVNQNNEKYFTNKENLEVNYDPKYLEKSSLDTFSAKDTGSFDPQERRCPLYIGKAHLKSPMRWTDSWFSNCIDEVANKWKTFQERRRKKNILRRQMSANESPLNFIDYTNSQMPFNEGKPRNGNSYSAVHQFSDAPWEDRKKSLFVEPYAVSVAEPKRFQRSVMKRRFKVPLRLQENILETVQDDPILGYSRVRRFLDHERAKKRKRMSGTLEAKEAAMSRILDPNLNLDGILEPHVRKRRGHHSKKRDLSFNLLHRRY